MVNSAGAVIAIDETGGQGMKHVLTHSFVLALVTCLLPEPGGRAAGQVPWGDEQRPTVFFGRALTNGRPVPVDSVIYAYVGDELCGEAEVVSPGEYRLVVGGMAADVVCNTAGRAVRFVIEILMGDGFLRGRLPATPEGAIQPGAEVRLDLRRAAGPGPPVPAGLPSGRSESVPLATACNNVVLTWPTGTPAQEVAAAVTPAVGLVAIWRFDANTRAFEAFSPLSPRASDLTTVNRLDAVFVCMRQPGLLARPVL
jgi:hypothetical protein